MLSQAFAITGISISSIPERWAPSLVIVIGLAGVVAVFTALLAMATGFESTLKATGRSDAALITARRVGRGAELRLRPRSTDLIKQEPGIAAGADGKPLASAEMMVIAELMRRDDVRNGANITVRGVEPAAFALRPQLQIIEGRNFTPGLRELIVGRGVLRAVPGRRDRQGRAHARLGLDRGGRVRSRAMRTTARCGPTSTSHAPPSVAPARARCWPRSTAPTAWRGSRAPSQPSRA